MQTIKVTVQDRIALISLDNGRSNAINAAMVTELTDMVRNIERDEQIRGVILTGKPGFFSAGLDLIEVYDYDKDQIRTFWHSFMDLTYTLAAFRKPFISAITGHSPAGGCVLAICTDYRVMATGNYIIGLNEVPVGIIVPDAIFQLYSFWLGKAKASRFLLEGKLLNPEEALEAGLIDELLPPDAVMGAAVKQMKKYIQLSASAWQKSKLNIRSELIAKLNIDHSTAIDSILEQWWSPQTRSILKTIITNLQKRS